MLYDDNLQENPKFYTFVPNMKNPFFSLTTPTKYMNNFLKTGKGQLRSKFTQQTNQNKTRIAAFLGIHVSPAKQSLWLQKGVTSKKM